MTLAAQLRNEESYQSSGGRLVSADGRTLPLTGATLRADARGGVMRVTLEQAFRNPHNEPLRVTYSLPLPADGAVSGFRFRMGDAIIVGEVDTKQHARQRFEDAILDGHTAALLDQERTSLFTQQVGNVPPRTEVHCEVTIDQKLAWLPDGCWEWRFPTVVAPRYLSANGRVADAAQVTVDVADSALPVRLGLSLSIRDALSEGRRPESPSHALHSERAVGHTRVTFADERGAGLDRDVVVRWRVAGQQPWLSLDVGDLGARLFGLVTLVPPAAEARMVKVPRDLIVLLDTSGSMGGQPLDQARRVTSALLDSLDDADQLELIEFSNSARRWKRGAVFATAANRREAQAWLARLQASGGTEMRTGILEALAPLRSEAQRQVVLMTDGLIGFENEIVDVIANRLPRGCRVHAVGIGSGVNRSLTQPAARAGRGLELIVGIAEDAEPIVHRLLARTSQPLVTNVEVSGTGVLRTAPLRLPDLYGGAPALISIELNPRGGTVTVTGDTAQGRFVEELRVPVSEVGSRAVPTLFARELVEDLELSLASGGQRYEVDRDIERLGLEFQISTRLTSWIAVSARQTVDPCAPRRDEVMPQSLPFGMSAEGVGLRSAGAQMAPVVSRAAAPSRPSRQSPGQSNDVRPVAGRQLASEFAGDDGMKTADKFVLREEDARAAPKPSSEPREDDPIRREVQERVLATARELERLIKSKSDKAATPEARQVERAKGSGAVPPAPAEPPLDAPAPASPPPPAPSGPAFGLFEKARKLFSSERRDEATPGGTPRGAAPTPRSLRAHVLRQANGETTLQVIVVDAPVRWALPNEVVVVLSDGSRLTVRVVKHKCTADGAHGVGLTLTLVLEVMDSRLSTVHLSSALVLTVG